MSQEVLGNSRFKLSGSLRRLSIKLEKLPRPKYLMAWIKAAFSLILLGLLLRFVSWQNLAAALLQAKPGWMVLAFVAAAGQVLVSAWRWGLLLRMMDVTPPPASRLVFDYLVSGFFNNFAPANLAGDASRIASLHRQGRGGVSAAGSVVLERVLNLAGLALLCLWALLAHPLPIVFKVSHLALGAGLGLGVFLLIGIAWVGIHPPKRLRPWVKEALRLAQEAFHRPKELIMGMLLTMLLHFVIMLITFCTVQAVRVGLPLSVHLAVYAVAGLALNLPISIQGIGLREGIYLGLFGLAGAAPERVLVALALNYGILISFSLLGGVLFSIGPRQGRLKAG